MTLPFSPWDIAVLLCYLLLVFGIGIYLSKRASRSTEEFFVSGRSLPWWIVGTSMVATTFAADTPLVVSGLVAQGGIYKNWLWWQYGIGAPGLQGDMVRPLPECAHHRLGDEGDGQDRTRSDGLGGGIDHGIER